MSLLEIISQKIVTPFLSDELVRRVRTQFDINRNDLGGI